MSVDWAPQPGGMLHCGRCDSTATLTLAKVENRPDAGACFDFKTGNDFLFSRAAAQVG